MSDALRKAYQQHAVACPRGGEGCPSAEGIAAAMRGAGDADTLQALATCTRCAAIAQIEVGLQAGREPAAVILRRGRISPLWAVAASLLLAVGAGWVVSVMRPQAADEVLRGSAGALHPQIGSELSGAPNEFRWMVPAGAICRVDVRRPTGERVWRSDGVRGGTAAFDGALPAGTYLWTVRCAADELGPFHFRVR